MDIPQLRDLSDVIVFSTKGAQSKVSLLSGGDFDGDKVPTPSTLLMSDMDMLG